jgi:hypothetical protein
MNTLSRDQQITIISAPSEGISTRFVERLTGIHRDTIMGPGTRPNPRRCFARTRHPAGKVPPHPGG